MFRRIESCSGSAVVDQDRSICSVVFERDRRIQLITEVDSNAQNEQILKSILVNLLGLVSISKDIAVSLVAVDGNGLQKLLF